MMEDKSELDLWAVSKVALAIPPGGSFQLTLAQALAWKPLRASVRGVC